MRVRFTRRAEQDIRDIYRYGVIEFGVKQAEIYAQGLDQACEAARDNPAAVRLRTEIIRLYVYGTSGAIISSIPRIARVAYS